MKGLQQGCGGRGCGLRVRGTGVEGKGHWQQVRSVGHQQAWGARGLQIGSEGHQQGCGEGHQQLGPLGGCRVSLEGCSRISPTPHALCQGRAGPPRGPSEQVRPEGAGVLDPWHWVVVWLPLHMIKPPCLLPAGSQQPRRCQKAPCEQWESESTGPGSGETEKTTR